MYRFLLQVPVEVRPEMLQELLGMGFGEARAARGLHFSGNSSIEGAINWLAEHEGEPDLDEPLLVPKVRRSGGSCSVGCGPGWGLHCMGQSSREC
jgi:uncharacterized UBP type Zn finger protein